MPFAPRPLEDWNYDTLQSGDRTILERLTDLFEHALYCESKHYSPITRLPLCFEDNVSILTELGFKNAINDLIDMIYPDLDILAPHFNELDPTDAHFLQAGMKLSHSENKFRYELAGRMYFVGFLFCRTPQETVERLRDASQPSGPWMLDQVVFGNQGQNLNIFYGLDHPNSTMAVRDLLKRVQKVNASFEKLVPHDESTSLFIQEMDEFNKDYASLMYKVLDQNEGIQHHNKT